MTYSELPLLAFSILSDSSSSTLTGVRNSYHSNNKVKDMLLATFLSSSCPSCPRKESGSMFACHLGCPAPLSSLSLPLRPTERLWAHRLASFEWRDTWIRKVFFSQSTGLDLQPIQRILMCRSPLEVLQMGHVHREIWAPVNYYQERIFSEP